VSSARRKVAQKGRGPRTHHPLMSLPCSRQESPHHSPGLAGALPDSLDKQPAWRRWIVQKIVYNAFLKWPVASQISSTPPLD